MFPLLFFALDVPNTAAAMKYFIMLRQIRANLAFKIGLELFIAEGKAIVQQAIDLGYMVFVDLKLHDIPETVKRSARQLAEIGADFITVHCLGGLKMLQAAAQGVEEVRAQNTHMTRVLGVTVLTSMDLEALRRIGIVFVSEEELQDYVVKLALLAKEAGCDGVVAAAKDIRRIRTAVGPNFLIVSPGIREPNATREDLGDQKRVGTPQQAVADGADAIVVGRPIRDAKDPAAKARWFQEQMRSA